MSSITVTLAQVQARRDAYAAGRVNLIREKRRLEAELKRVDEDLLATGGACEGFEKFLKELEALPAPSPAAEPEIASVEVAPAGT